ncbi:MAG: hypothetical protein KKC85_21490, partial [Gammaproteobacteria bacterium]|nr:hypothetical protein [Gammaproteobacteria bacterium]
MVRHKLTLPIEAWPNDLRARFERQSLSAAQRARLRHALGRWLKTSVDLGVDARNVSRESWQERTAEFPHEIRNDVRHALSIAFPKHAALLYEGDGTRVDRISERDKLQSTILRNLSRFPDDWRLAAAPLLHVDPSEVGDGILVQAWAASTIKRRLETAAAHFDYCRASGCDVDITPMSVRAKLREDQARVNRG